MRGRISALSTLCKRFAAVMRRCDVESFLNIGRLYAEIAPMEKRLDMHIDLLRRDEFREMECVSDVVKYDSTLRFSLNYNANPMQDQRSVRPPR
jgi:dynactin 1